LLHGNILRGVLAGGVHPGPSAVLENHYTKLKICITFLAEGSPLKTAKKRLELKSLKGQTKAEAVGDPVSGGKYSGGK
jgi:hypothetical protein